MLSSRSSSSSWTRSVDSSKSTLGLDSSVGSNFGVLTSLIYFGATGLGVFTSPGVIISPGVFLPSVFTSFITTGV